MIKAEQVSWSIGDKTILKDISLAISRNEVVALIGPNGCGKSSLIRLLSGLRTPDIGQITLNDIVLNDLKKNDIARNIAVVEQESKTPIAMSAYDVVMLGRIPYWKNWQRASKDDKNIVLSCLNKVGLENLTQRNWEALSGGEKQRVQLAKSLAQQTDFLLLDEPTNHLDIHHQHEFLGLLRETTKGCLISLHDLNLASIYSDRAVLLNNGRIECIGDTQSVLQTEDIERVYSIACKSNIGLLDQHQRFHFREKTYAEAINQKDRFL